MTDRYEKIRRALEMGPTPGPWRPSKSYGAIVSDSPSGHDDAESVHAYGGHMVCESVQEHNRHLIAACDPDTIRDLLAERDQLAAEIEALRAEVERLAEVLSKILENEASDWKAAEEFGGYVLDDELREEARAALQPAAVDGAIDKARFERAPCYLCGYNGPGYYQPDTHPRAAEYHAAQVAGSKQ